MIFAVDTRRLWNNLIRQYRTYLLVTAHGFKFTFRTHNAARDALMMSGAANKQNTVLYTVVAKGLNHADDFVELFHIFALLIQTF